MAHLYFAYGSNMSTQRLRDRIPAAEPRGAAHLEGMRLVFDKRGRDGSAKATLEVAQGERVWGVLYLLPDDAWAKLDGIELGYTRTERDFATTAAQTTLRAWLYLARDAAREPVSPGFAPSESYRDYLVAGAREHGLPAAYVAKLERIVVLPDPASRNDRA